MKIDLATSYLVRRADIWFDSISRHKTFLTLNELFESARKHFSPLGAERKANKDLEKL